jgi:hypothetical protein
MRACFLGQNVTALGFGVAMLQTPPMVAEPPLENHWRSHSEPERDLKADDAPQHAPEPPPRLKVEPLKVTSPEAA